MLCTLILSLLAGIFGVNVIQEKQIVQEKKLILPATVNQYNDVEVVVKPLKPLSAAIFETILQSSLQEWKAEGRKTVWLTLPLTCSELIPTVLQHHFVCHHATKNEIVFTHLLIDGMESTIPNYGNYTIGVAGLVIDDNNNVLVVKDRYRPDRGFKLPGGGVDSDEELWQGAIREVKEETGIDTEFIGIICWRRHHKPKWDCSDLYFGCLLRPLTFELFPQENEIAECCWMPYDHYKTIAQEPFLSFIQEYEKNGAPVTCYTHDELRTMYTIAH